MNTEENQSKNSVLASQEPHQKEEMDQATAASEAAFTLNADKGVSPDPKDYNKGGEQGNIKQMATIDHEQPASYSNAGFDPVSEIDLEADENSVTGDDLQVLGGADENPDEEENTMS